MSQSASPLTSHLRCDFGSVSPVLAAMQHWLGGDPDCAMLAPSSFLLERSGPVRA